MSETPMTNAERQAAHRARREQEIRDHFGYAASETRTQAERAATARRIIGRTPHRLTEDEYVAECMKLTPIVPVTETKAEHEVAYRQARARQEAYARWRFKAFHAGEVAGL